MNTTSEKRYLLNVTPKQHAVILAALRIAAARVTTVQLSTALDEFDTSDLTEDYIDDLREALNTQLCEEVEK